MLFALALTLVPPAALLLLEALARLAAPALQRALHVVFLALLAAAVALQLLKQLADRPAIALVAGAVALGVALAVAVARIRTARTFLVVLAPAPLVFLGLFLFSSPVSKLVFPAKRTVAAAPVEARAPVVVVVFDEFPAASLLDEDREIDEGRFPNFARLAATSTWFRNATTVTGLTTQAVPTILTGRYPKEGTLPVFSEQPENLFTLLGKSYRIEAVESVTRLCPTDLCREAAEPAAERAESLAEDVGLVYLHVLLPEEIAARLPSVSDNWGGFLGDDDRPEGRTETRGPAPRRDPARRAHPAANRGALFEDFIASLEPGAQETLYFLHVLLPHRPWTYLPSGKDYGNADVRAFGQNQRGFWTHDEALLRQAYQRYLLQLGYVDLLVGKLLDRLEATGLDRTSLLVVTADHGLGFTPGGAPRGVQASNLHELGPVPLFVSRPGQRRGRVVSRNVQTIDVLPTIADALDVRIPWAVDGRSAFERTLDRRTLRFAGGYTVDSSELERRKYAALEERVAIFGTGADPLRVFRIGPYGRVVGRRVAELETSTATHLTAQIDDPAKFRRVDPSSGFLPAFVTGRLDGGGAGADLALALNGRVGAVARTFELFGETRFAAMLPESVFRAGANEVGVFAVSGPAAAPVLAPISVGR